MLPCKEIVRLLSSGEALPLMKRAELKMHLMMCKHCSRYSKHLVMLADGFKRLFQEKAKVDPSQVERVEKKVIEEVEKKKSSE